jgi:dihydropteroate synthase
MRMSLSVGQVRIVPCRELTLELGQRTLIMGILNVTPDSFSDGGLYNTIDSAVAQAKLMVEQGADILDIGGESTRPGFMPISAEEELERVIPVIRAIRQQLPSIPISIDTYKASVAREALEAGVHIVNDIWRLTADSDMARVVAEYGCPVILMHNRKPRPYGSLIEDVIADLQESIAIAYQAGISDEQIILDPGIGFAKDTAENLAMMTQLYRLKELGYPVLLATSRKRFIRYILDLPPEDVVEGTAATVVMGIVQGCDIVRVHDVQAIARTVRMTDAMVRRADSALFYKERR